MNLNKLTKAQLIAHIHTLDEVISQHARPVTAPTGDTPKLTPFELSKQYARAHKVLTRTQSGRVEYFDKSHGEWVQIPV